MKWLLQVAEKGDATAMNKIGFNYSYGQGVAKDHKEAMKWYLMAAEKGNATAMANIGVSYQDGTGVAKDLQEARKWYLRAEEVEPGSQKSRLATLDRLQGPPASNTPFNGLVTQTFFARAMFNAARSLTDAMCTEIVSPTIKMMVEGKVTGGIPADPTKELPAVFAQVDFVCENKVMGSRQPSTVWVRVAFDNDFKVPRCQWTSPASKKPFEEQFAEVSNLVCKFSPYGSITTPVFHSMY